MTNIIPEIIINPELKTIKITVANNRTTFKFRSKEEQEKYLPKCEMFVEELNKIDCEFTRRAQFKPDSDCFMNKNEIIFKTREKNNDENCRQNFTIKI